MSNASYSLRLKAVGFCLLLTSLAVPATAVAEEAIVVPVGRIGDRWSVEVVGDRYDVTVLGHSTARDRWGRLRSTVAVDVQGFHPVALESKRVTRHLMHLDAASGTQVADVTEYAFAGEGVTSQPAAYAAYEPNDPDGWPGWVASGGLLAGRVLVPGDVIELPFVMTSTRGASSIAMAISPAPPRGEVDCAAASGRTDFPSYTSFDGQGYRRSSLSVAVDAVYCEDSPYAHETRITYSGAFNHSVDFARASFVAGSGDALGTERYAEPFAHVAAGLAHFEGRLRDGGSSDDVSVEAAQDAAALAPGLVAWRAVHPDGYLVEAHHEPATSGLPETWRLIYSAPSRALHEVRAVRVADSFVAHDLPRTDAYPAPVPPLDAWPREVVSLDGAIDAWQTLAGDGARVEGLRWQPLLDYRWYVTGRIDVFCDGAKCGDVFMEIPFDYETGAAGTGEHPLPQDD